MLRCHLARSVDAAAREAVLARFEQALVGEAGWTDAFGSLTRSTLAAVLNRQGWTLLSGALPRAAAGLAIADVLRDRSWSRVVTLLPALAANLPSLRSHAQFEALVQALPEALRESIATLHGWVDHLDAPFAPRLQVPPLTAVAASALLWYLQRALPAARAPREGVPAFIAALPHHWQRLAGLNRLGGTLLEPPSSGAPLRGITHVDDGVPHIVPAPARPPSRGDTPRVSSPSRQHPANTPDQLLPVASSAAPQPRNALATLGATLVTSGVLMIRQGWQLAFGGSGAVPQPDAAMTPDAAMAVRPVGDLIVLLDEIVDIEGNATLWEDLYTRILAEPALDRDVQVDRVQARLIANDVADVVLYMPAPDTSTATAPAHRRLRRAVNDHSPLPRTVGNDSATAHRRDGLRAASEQLVDAALELPPGPSHPEEVVIGNEDRVALAMARMHLRRWMRQHGRTVQQQHVALSAAVRALGLSDDYMARVGRGLPNLDDHIAQQLEAQIRRTSNITVDPRAIYLNTFRTYPCWPEWEAGQVPAPDAELQAWYRSYPRDRRIREGLVSSRDLVEASVQPLETNPERSGLYRSGMPGTYFPNEEAELTLAQYNQAINGSRYIESFQQAFDTFMANCSATGPHPERDAYVEAMSQRLAGTTTLLYAMGQLTEGQWLLRTLLKYPTQFGTGAGNTTLGRALALPGQDIRVHALVAQPAGGGNVSLHGLVLAQALPSAERSKGAVVVISPTRLPLIQEFASQAEALQHVAADVPHQLHSWVSARFHSRWRAGNGPVVLGESVEGDFTRYLFMQQLKLRSDRLNHTASGTAADTRREFNALDRRLLALPPPVTSAVLEAANERVAATMVDPYGALGVHWLVHLGLPSRGILRNARWEDFRWLKYMETTRDLLVDDYPTPERFVADALELALLNKTGKAIDSTDHYIVRFSGGTASAASPSGFVHDALQKTGACRMVECAFDKARGYPDGSPGSYELGLYTSDNSTVYDQDTEVAGLLPGQFISVVRGLDLRAGYLDAIGDFWKRQRNEVKTCLRGVYMFSAWQQFAEGSLSARGLQLAIAATGYMLSTQAEDPAFTCHMAEGSRVSWISVYGAPSTLMRIDHAGGPEVLLYSPGDGVAFREFPDVSELRAWLGRVVASPQGRSWLEAAFDLADLQDGWFSNGVSSVLGSAPSDLFKDNSTGPVITGGDLFDAMATRLEQRTGNDARTLLSSNWETWRDLLQRRLQAFDLIVGVLSIPIPALMPIVAVGSGIEAGLGIEKSIDGRTEADRHEGAVDAAWGAAGVALTVPFIGAHSAARTAALSTAEGARLIPEIQAVADVAGAARADPLAELSARYAQPASLVVEGARPADNGIYHFAGRHYIRQGGNVYEVAFDKFNRTWRLKNPDPGKVYQNPVRLNAEGMWEPHSDVGLRGGAPETSPVARGTSVDVSYNHAVLAEIQRSSQSLDSAGADFRWGRSHWERVELPREVLEANSLSRMQEFFVAGHLEPAQRGALSVIIARLRQTMGVNRALRVTDAVATAVRSYGGAMLPVSQMMLDTGQASRMGWCTGISRIFALGMAEGKQGNVVRNLRLAMRRPGEGLGAELLGTVRNAQGAALLPGTTSAATAITYGEIGQLLDGARGNAQFFITGAVHHMAAAVTQLPNGEKIFELFDPNIGLIRFYKRSKFDRLMNYLFGSRYFSALTGTSSRAGRETLAEMYGATRPITHASASRPFSQASATQFMIRQVDPEKLVRQARARGWDRMLHDVPD